MKKITINGKDYELRKDNIIKKMIQALNFEKLMSLLLICSGDEELLDWGFSQISEEQKTTLLLIGILE